MLVWIQAARIKTLYASLSPVMVGVALAANQGSINVLVFICTLIAAVFIQVGTNLANDYYDYKNGVDNKNRWGSRRIGNQVSAEMITEDESEFATKIIDAQNHNNGIFVNPKNCRSVGATLARTAHDVLAK